MYINILGFGITNQSIVNLLNHNNIKCKIYDDKFIENNTDLNNEYYLFSSVDKFLQNGEYEYNLAIISPGIPPSLTYLRYFKKIISEYDFIYGFLPKLYSIWISGTNGKTTSTEMTSCMLGAKSGGNIGTPLANLFMQDLSNELISLDNIMNYEDNNVYEVCNFSESKVTWILETSSFTLHYTNFALPNLYILLPISQDHISWHGSYDEYILDKIKPLKLMNKSISPKKYYAIIPYYLKQCNVAKDVLDNAKANILYYKDSKQLFDYLQCDYMYYETFKEPFRLDFMLSASGMKFAQIPFNIQNILQYKIGVCRMEERFYKNILFVNDSKATNPHAVLAALNTYKEYVIYIVLGGDAKGADISIIYPFIKEHNVKVFSIGVDGGSIANECSLNEIWVKDCVTLDVAMSEIHKQISKDVDFNKDSKNKVAVMLSPACASLDQYKSYKHRGEHFLELIDKIF